MNASNRRSTKQDPPAGAHALAVLHGMVVPPPPPTVQVEAPCGHAFSISRLCAIGRWFREVGYTAAILSHDPCFDETWACETADREFGEALIREREARATIERLHGLGCAGLTHNGKKLTAVLSRAPRGRSRDEALKADVRAELDALGGVISRLCARRSFPHEVRSGRTVVAVGLLCLGLAAGIAGLAMGASELLDGELARLTLRSLLFSVPLLAVFLLAMTLLLAGRSAAHKELGLVVLFAVIALPMLGVGAAAHINRALDDGAATLRRVPVLELQQPRGKGGQRPHFAIVPGWRDGLEPLQRLKVSRAMAADIVPGRTWLIVATSPGKLDAERLLSVAIEESGSP